MTPTDRTDRPRRLPKVVARILAILLVAAALVAVSFGAWWLGVSMADELNWSAAYGLPLALVALLLFVFHQSRPRIPYLRASALVLALAALGMSICGVMVGTPSHVIH